MNAMCTDQTIPHKFSQRTSNPLSKKFVQMIGLLKV